MTIPEQPVALSVLLNHCPEEQQVQLVEQWMKSYTLWVNEMARIERGYAEAIKALGSPIIEGQPVIDQFRTAGMLMPGSLTSQVMERMNGHPVSVSDMKRLFPQHRKRIGATMVALMDRGLVERVSVGVYQRKEAKPRTERENG